MYATIHPLVSKELGMYPDRRFSDSLLFVYLNSCKFMLRYSFAPRAKRETDETTFANAVMLTDLAEILSANESKQYSFVKDDNLTNAFRKATEIAVSVDYTTNGTKVNKVRATLDGKVYNLSIFGANKEIKPAGTFDNETAKKCVFGTCKSAGEIVGSNGYDKNGKPCRIPTIYIVFPEDAKNI